MALGVAVSDDQTRCGNKGKASCPVPAYILQEFVRGTVSSKAVQVTRLLLLCGFLPKATTFMSVKRMKQVNSLSIPLHPADRDAVRPGAPHGLHYRKVLAGTSFSPSAVLIFPGSNSTGRVTEGVKLGVTS